MPRLLRPLALLGLCLAMASCDFKIADYLEHDLGAKTVRPRRGSGTTLPGGEREDCQVLMLHQEERANMSSSTAEIPAELDKISRLSIQVTK